MSTELVITLALAIAGLLLEVSILVVGGVWIVGKISATTKVLVMQIKHLEESIQSLRDWLETVGKTTANHGERLAALEAKQE